MKDGQFLHVALAASGQETTFTLEQRDQNGVSHAYSFNLVHWKLETALYPGVQFEVMLRHMQLELAKIVEKSHLENEDEQ
jgi:hypothetical protein